MPSRAILLTLLFTACAAPQARPNVVFVLTDDQRWDMLGAAGHPHLKTPHIDRLAKEGVRFSNAFVTRSLCSPSRASFLSGLYPHAHRVVDNFTDYPRTVPSFPQHLKKSGYATAYVGKWHMGENEDAPRPGFDHWMSHTGQGQYQDTTFNVNGTRAVRPGYYTTVVTDEAVRWIAGRDERPFMLIVGHKAPHSPNVPERRYEHSYDGWKITYPETAFALEGKPGWVRERLSTWHGIHGPLWGFRERFPGAGSTGVEPFSAFVRAYTATINSVDDSVGRLIRALEEKGVLDDTVFVFASDNGFLLGEHGMMDKRTMNDESIRIPLVVRYPRAARVGAVADQLVLNVDVAPTLLELCAAPPLPRVHGQSMVPLLRGEATTWRRSFFYAYDYERQFPYTPNVRGVRTAQWKYVRYPRGGGTADDAHAPELYDLDNDPGERRNLAGDPKYRGQVATLRAELDRLMAELGALPDNPPLDEGVKTELPDAKIR